MNVSALANLMSEHRRKGLLTPARQRDSASGTLACGSRQALAIDLQLASNSIRRADPEEQFVDVPAI